MAAGFDHYDSRAHDPNLHTHLAIANRVQGSDGLWRAIDARGLHAATVAFSELYDGLLADHLTSRLPLEFGWRDRGIRRDPAFDVHGVDERLITAFSSRGASIDATLVSLLTAFETAHGRRPDRVEVIKLRQQATLATRPDKTVRSLPQLRAEWAGRAEQISGHPGPDAVRTALDSPAPLPMPLPTPLPLLLPLEELAASIVDGVAARRSTWTAWNLTAEAARALKPHRFATTADRLYAVDALTQSAQALCVRLHDPTALDRSALARARWTSQAVLDAEHRLLAAATDLTAPTTRLSPADSVGLGADQAAALVLTAGSGRRVEVLVGPAGSGKTTLLNRVARAWQHTHGHGSVIGLAPSAAAAEVLAASLGIRCENTAKWLHDTYDTLNERLANRGWPLRGGQLVIVDEASLASTASLDALAGQASAAGAKLLLVGDHHQLAAVEAGAAFGLLARRTRAAELTALWRFSNPWEGPASRRLRHGHPQVLDTYAAHHRVHENSSDIADADAAEAAYVAWRDDVAAGRDSLLLAHDRGTVTALNARARADRILTGASSPVGVPLRDATTAGTGDTVVTRLNARGFTDRIGRYVRNGDTWTVQQTTPGGDLYLTRTGPDTTPATTAATFDQARAWHHRPDVVVLPRYYVGEHVELGYAATVHRAQGRTVDTCHLVAAPGMAREHLYVGLTRGRDANHVYIDTDHPTDDETHRSGTTRVAGRRILEQIMATSTAETSATEYAEALENVGHQRLWYETPDPQHLRSTAHAAGLDGPTIGR
ncbi:MAG: AAA family ATPase [Kineosporiaceae bacterium]|nr:AAA family ATPase [Kineosporiaceae bacterium]